MLLDHGSDYLLSFMPMDGGGCPKPRGRAETF